MIEITFKDAYDAKHAINSGEIEEGDWVIDDKKNIELYVHDVYKDVQSIHSIALICYEQLYDDKYESAIGIGKTAYFITPAVLAHLRVEKEEGGAHET